MIADSDEQNHGNNNKYYHLGPRVPDIPKAQCHLEALLLSHIMSSATSVGSAQAFLELRFGVRISQFISQTVPNLQVQKGSHHPKTAFCCNLGYIH